MLVQLVDIDAIAPTRANPTDAGIDLYSPIDIIIKGKEHAFIDLGIIVAIPHGMAGFIYARSGLGTRFGVRPRNCVGVIDETYRGNLGIMLENDGYIPYVIKRGDRIAQLVITPISNENVEVVDEIDTDNARQGGFGSSGK